MRHNISIVSLRDYAKRGQIDFGWERDTATAYIEKLLIKTPHDKAHIRNLSGGNQQKVVVAKWLATNADIIILDEPTRGIDIGAKYEIYLIMNRLVKEGKSIIMISSEMPELIGMSDRIIVMHQGSVSGELTKEEVSQERILEMASGM